MGWTESHLHQFILGKRPNFIYALPPDPEDDYGLPSIDSNHLSIQELMRRGNGKAVYEYDFGDSWEHEVRLEKGLPPEAGTRVPVCLGGERACPPEDCGGTWGYEDIVKMLKDPRYEPENGPREELMQWVGKDFDPEAFDLEEVNEVLLPRPRKRTKGR